MTSPVFAIVTVPVVPPKPPPPPKERIPPPLSDEEPPEPPIDWAMIPVESSFSVLTIPEFVTVIAPPFPPPAPVPPTAMIP